jgi:hypothetical protein
MNISNCIDWDYIAEQSGVYSSYENYVLCDDECYIQVGDTGVEIIIVMGIDNGCHGNDPSWEGAIYTITLDENLYEINSVHEVQ